MQQQHVVIAVQSLPQEKTLTLSPLPVCTPSTERRIRRCTVRRWTAAASQEPDTTSAVAMKWKRKACHFCNKCLHRSRYHSRYPRSFIVWYPIEMRTPVRRQKHWSTYLTSLDEGSFRRSHFKQNRHAIFFAIFLTNWGLRSVLSPPSWCQLGTCSYSVPGPRKRLVYTVTFNLRRFSVSYRFRPVCMAKHFICKMLLPIRPGP